MLTQASVLTVSSYPTRTSPVLRGKWILENILNDAAAAAAARTSRTWTRRQSAHRRRCASSWSSIAPIRPARLATRAWIRWASAWRTTTPIGHWRDQGRQVPHRRRRHAARRPHFRSPAELKAILRADRRRFRPVPDGKDADLRAGPRTGTLRPASGKLICSRLAASDYRFSRLVLEIVESLPFQMRRGEARVRAAPAVAFAGGKP